LLIDVHAHLGRLLPDQSEQMDAANLIAKCDAWGVDLACVLPLSEHPEGGYLAADTEAILLACEHYPDRLIPFCLLDPRFGNRPEPDFRYLLEEYKARGCKGVGEFLPKLPFDDPRCLALYQQAGEVGLPVLFDLMDSPWHYGLRDEPGLPGLERALQLCPQTIFIGHGPTFWGEISGEVPVEYRWGYPPGPVGPGGAVPRLMRQYETLWADTSAGSGYNALTRDESFGLEFLEEFHQRLLFGIDSCLASDVERIPPIIAFFKKLREEKLLPEPVLEAICWRKAACLLDLPGGGAL
jgi:hypothetical protein